MTNQSDHRNNLKRAIEASGRKRKFIAERLGISRMTLHRYEHGERPVPPDAQDTLRELLPETPLHFTEEEMLNAA